MTYQMKVDVEHPQMEPKEVEPFVDVYGTEIGEGEKYYMNQHDEVIHPDNIVQWLLEDHFIQEKTR